MPPEIYGSIHKLNYKNKEHARVVMKEREAKRVKHNNDADELLNALKAECTQHRFSFEYYKKVIEQLKTCVSDDPRWTVYFQFVTDFLLDENLTQKEFLDCFFLIRSELHFHREKLESSAQWMFLHQLLVIEEQWGLVLGIHANYTTNDEEIYFRLDNVLLELILEDAKVAAHIFKLFGINQVTISANLMGLCDRKWQSFLELIFLSRPIGVKLHFLELTAERVLSLTNALMMCSLRKLVIHAVDFNQELERRAYFNILKELIPSISELEMKTCSFRGVGSDFWNEFNNLFSENTIRCFRLTGSCFVDQASTIECDLDNVLKKMKKLQLLELSYNSFQNVTRLRIANVIKTLPINHLILRETQEFSLKLFSKEGILSCLKDSQIVTLTLKGYDDLTDEDKKKIETTLRENHIKYGMRQSLKLGLLSYISSNPHLLFSKKSVLPQDLQEEITELSNQINTQFKY